MDFVGDTHLFTAEVQYEDCYGGLTPHQPVTDFVNWSTSNTAVAAINAGGLATAEGAGATTITAKWTMVVSSYNPLTGSCRTLGSNQTRTAGYTAISVGDVTASGATKVTDVAGNADIGHFVTPKGGAGEKVTLSITVTPNTDTVRSKIDWEGATEDPANPLQATVPKDAAGKNVVRVKYSGAVAKELRVWVVWATLTGGVDTNFTAQLLFTESTQRRVGVSVQPKFACTATIAPKEIVTDDDRPDLSGANTFAGATVPPPGVASPSGQSLSGGADRKWDMSRKIARRMTVTAANPGMIPAAASDFNFNFPVSPVIGNDDVGTSDEAVNPYSALFIGVLTSKDIPTRTYGTDGGNVGQTYVNQTWFQEFARLLIGDTWYAISDPFQWRVEFRFKKVQVTEETWDLDANGDGDKNDNITEGMMNIDYNGDGDKNDLVGYWEDDGSIARNDNEGAP